MAISRSVHPLLVFVLWAVVVVFILMQRDESGFFYTSESCE